MTLWARPEGRRGKTSSSRDLARHLRRPLGDLPERWLDPPRPHRGHHHDAVGEVLRQARPRFLGLAIQGAGDLTLPAETGDPRAFEFRRTLFESDVPDFSFSGSRPPSSMRPRGRTPGGRPSPPGVAGAGPGRFLPGGGGRHAPRKAAARPSGGRAGNAHHRGAALPPTGGCGERLDRLAAEERVSDYTTRISVSGTDNGADDRRTGLAPPRGGIVLRPVAGRGPRGGS